MSIIYTRTSTDPSPVSLPEMKSYLKDSPSVDDTIVQLLIDACTEYGEGYTGRSFRKQQFNQTRDSFEDRMLLDRDPVVEIVSIQYLKSNVLISVLNTVYYIKKGVSCSEVLLLEDQSWPDDVDNIEAGIIINFKTAPYFLINQIKESIYRHTAYAYANRGDCSMSEAAEKSGVNMILNQFRISRV